MLFKIVTNYFREPNYFLWNPRIFVWSRPLSKKQETPYIFLKVNRVHFKDKGRDFLNTDFNLVMKRQKRSKAKKSWSVRPRTTKVKQFCRHSLYLHTPRCSSFQFDVLMNCGNSDPAHPSYPHGRLEAARINTAVKNGKGLISHYNINLTKTLAILNSS